MIGKHIRQLRKNKRMSLSDLAERAGIAKSYLSNIERGLQSNPSIHFLKKVSLVLEIPVESLLHLSGYPAGSESEGMADTELDAEWLELIREAAEIGISKEAFREYLEFVRWKKSRGEQTSESKN